MERLIRLLAALPAWLGRIGAWGALLMGLMLVALAWPQVGLAYGGPFAAASAQQAPGMRVHPKPTATPRPKPSATPTPRFTPTPSLTPTTTSQALTTDPSPTPQLTPSSTASAVASNISQQRKMASAPPWLVEGLLVLFAVLLVFSLIILPLAMRAARTERRSRPAVVPTPTRRPSGQVARLSQIPPERKEPLSREQLQSLREARPDGSQHASGASSGMHIVDGVPVSLPITPPPHRPDARWPFPSRRSQPRASDTPQQGGTDISDGS